MQTHLLSSIAIISTLALTSCAGEEEVRWDAQYVRVTVPANLEITRLAFAFVRPNDTGPATKRPAPEEKGWEIGTANDASLPKGGLLIKLNEPEGGGVAWLRGIAYKDDSAVAAGRLRIDTTAHGERTMALTSDDPCDKDQDGARDCKTDGCCAANEPSDCDDDPTSGAASSPWNAEVGCETCGNKIDEDCSGQDLACQDSDGDGHADCKEASCGPEAANQKTVYPGAPELCDGIDNNCDGNTDEAQPYTPINSSEPKAELGQSCGLGACAGGTASCKADGSGLYCTTADKKSGIEDCNTPIDDDCNGKINEGCNLDDPDGDGVSTPAELAACAAPLAPLLAEFHPGSKEGCCLVYTALVLQLDPDWQPDKSIPKGAMPTKKMLEKCDFNCDKVISACDPEDEDGDGVPAPLDCDDTDPLRFPGAPERCGDGVLQSCLGADPSCDGVDDADGDGWPDKGDCAPKDKNRHPGATELCNGLDDDCDGVVDNGAPGGKLAACTGCGAKSCVTACLHQSTAPAAGVCIGTPWTSSSGSCVACMAKP
ncbi:MAG: putative metal-binding motif-containing protein [Myxococcales bacterium]|nr:putative metal-binding motif-containing protein [Myxococcales bacterium]